MRKTLASALVLVCVLGLTATAFGQSSTVARTYTWTLLATPGAYEVWHNEANSPSMFDANDGLLGRVVTAFPGDTPVLGTGVNACELAPSYDCDTGSPPAFLLPSQPEGPTDTPGSGLECNREVTACSGAPIGPNPGHAASPSHTGRGAYSYFIIHTRAAGTRPVGKVLGFFSGSFVQRVNAYECNGCPPTGGGFDVRLTGTSKTPTGTTTFTTSDNGFYALANTMMTARVTPLSVNIWTTQVTPGFGHNLFTLLAPGPGVSSKCGNGVGFQDLGIDMCVTQQPSIDFTIPNQKVTVTTYSTMPNPTNGLAQHANSPAVVVDDGGTPGVPADDTFGDQALCNGPDCYVEKVIIPAAAVHATAIGGGTARNIMVQKAITVLPADAPSPLGLATMDSLIFAWTSQLLDMDGDGREDRIDPCPNNASATCSVGGVAQLTQGGPTMSPSVRVACSDLFGRRDVATAGDDNLDGIGRNPYLCNSRVDVTPGASAGSPATFSMCRVNTLDKIALEGTGTAGANTAPNKMFNNPFNVGPFDP